MQDTPKPTNTKQAAKRKKHTFGPKSPGMRRPNPIGLIYRNGTDAIVADEATEARLSSTGPSTSPRFGGMQFIW
jgi:hypothetical protein